MRHGVWECFRNFQFIRIFWGREPHVVSDIDFDSSNRSGVHWSRFGEDNATQKVHSAFTDEARSVSNNLSYLRYTESPLQLQKSKEALEFYGTVRSFRKYKREQQSTTEKPTAN